MSVAFKMRRPLDGVVAALILFGTLAVLSGLARIQGWVGPLGAGLAILSGVLAVGAGLAVRNLLAHEGWAVVLGDDALELPTAPYRSRLRDRIPYAAIVGLGLTPPPPAAPEVLIIEAESEPGVRWVRQADLAGGDLRELHQQLEARVQQRRGPGRTVRIAPG